MKKILLIALVICAGGHASASPGSLDTLRVLAIGNSFSTDAVEENLHELGLADGVVLVIGNMYIGGCSLETHRNNAAADAPAYSYRRIGADGQKTITPDARLSEVISAEPWNVITFQQTSPLSGVYDSWFPDLPELMEYAGALATNPDVKWAIHQTWAYARDSSHTGFANYGNDQPTMYRAIVDAVSRVAEATGIEVIIPAGTAIQKARSSRLGDTLCRDGYHLDLTVGRYTAACTWYETLTGHRTTAHSFAPASLTPAQIRIAHRSAHRAVRSTAKGTLR